MLTGRSPLQAPPRDPLPSTVRLAAPAPQTLPGIPAGAPEEDLGGPGAGALSPRGRTAAASAQWAPSRGYPLRCQTRGAIWIGFQHLVTCAMLWFGVMSPA